MAQVTIVQKGQALGVSIIHFEPLDPLDLWPVHSCNGLRGG